MKQYITIEQLNELSQDAKTKLRDWWKPAEGDVFINDNWTGEQVCNGLDKDGLLVGDECLIYKSNSLPLLSIGQMIEYLKEEKPDIYIGTTSSDAAEVINDFWTVGNYDHYELCDALWEAVKKKLETDQ